MKKKLPPAKVPLPKFRTDKEAAEYFDSHSVAEVWDRLPAGKPAKLSSSLAKSIRARHAQEEIDGSKDAVVQLDKHSAEAIHQAISHSVVGVIGREGTGRVGEIGTGTLVQIGSRRCILTAKHVLKRWALTDLRFFLPLPGARFQTSEPPSRPSVEDFKAWQALNIDSAFCGGLGLGRA
jgi:hypothetical protein